MISRGYSVSMSENKRLDNCGYSKNNVNVAMRLQVLQQNIPLLWQLINHKRIVYIPELLRCHTVIMVNFKNAHTGFPTMKKVSFFIG